MRRDDYFIKSLQKTFRAESCAGLLQLQPLHKTQRLSRQSAVSDSKPYSYHTISLVQRNTES